MTDGKTRDPRYPSLRIFGERILILDSLCLAPDGVWSCRMP
jgi:hypothetical protein